MHSHAERGNERAKKYARKIKVGRLKFKKNIIIKKK